MIVLAVMTCWLGWSITKHHHEMITTFNGIQQSIEQPISILIVGGSDGSGTRTFCSALQQLGVVLLVDDRRALDIQASQLFSRTGWPGFLDYTWNDLSLDARVYFAIIWR